MKNNVKIQDDTQSLQSCVSVSVTPLELRIGNLLQHEFGKIRYGSVTQINENSVRLKMEFSRLIVSYKDVEPISITEEWLLNLGFNECNGRHGKYYKHNKSELFRIWMSDLCTWGVGRKDENSVGKEYNTYWMKLDLKYIHQLQNLYHALTGSDLQISSITEH